MDKEDNILDFDVNGEIIAVIKRHRANTATMAREIVTLTAELQQAQKCDLCDLQAGYRLCQSHMDDMRWPDVFSTDEQYPEPGRMVLWHDSETYIGGYDPAGGWFAQGHECDNEQPEGRVLWAYLVDLEYTFNVLQAVKGKGLE
jgi:hypothetical protein